MRVPGTWHRKSEPFLARIYCKNDRLPYHADEFPKTVQPARTPSEGDQVNLIAVKMIMPYVPPTLEREQRIKVGMAIHRGTGGSEEGFATRTEWLERGGKWSRAKARRSWRGFRPERIGIGSLFHWAVPDWQQHFDKKQIEIMERAARERYDVGLYELCGLADPEQQAAGERVIKNPAPDATEQADHAPFVAPPPRTTLIVPSTTFIANFVPPDYLVDGWLQRRFIYSFTGLTGTGKTAIALRLTAHVAFGLPLGAREVEQGKVLYLAGENPDDVRMRWIKLCEEMGLGATTDAVFWREGTMLLSNSNLWQLLIQDCRVAGPFALVVIDTAAAYYTGQDENDNVQAGSYARLLRQFTKRSLVVQQCWSPRIRPRTPRQRTYCRVVAARS